MSIDDSILAQNSNLQNQEWYELLVEECKAIITEATFTSRWALVEGYWLLGKRIREEYKTRKELYGKKIAQGLAESIGVSERTINYACAAYDKYPDIDKLPEGKNISWNKLITKYLPEPQKNEEPLTEEQKSTFKKQIIQGDCIDEMKKLPDKSIDMIYADPPYNVSKAEWDTFDATEYDVFTIDWIRECLRVLKPSSNFYIHHTSAGIWRMYDLTEKTFNLTPDVLVWNYRNLVQGRDSKTKYLSTYQPILHINLGNKELNFDKMWSDERFDVQTVATPQTNFEEGKVHITQKPLELMEWLVRTGSNKGEVVLDPMAGSGTTGIACLKNDRDFILIEKEPEYIEIIHRRLNDI